MHRNWCKPLHRQARELKLYTQPLSAHSCPVDKAPFPLGFPLCSWRGAQFFWGLLDSPSSPSARVTPTRQLSAHKADSRAGQILVPQNNQKANCREGGWLKEEQGFWSAKIHPKSLQRCKRNGPAPISPPNNSISVFVAS